MKQWLKGWSMPLSILILSFSLVTFTLAQEIEDQSEFNYIEGSKKGPENWGLLKEEWAICNIGKKQSPVDLFQLETDVVPQSEKIIKHYNPEKAILKNRGHDIILKWQGGSSRIQINDTNYILRQCHWHTPSEHTINGISYALELHLVHQSLDGNIAVIGILFTYGKPDPLLSKLMEDLKVLANNSTIKEVDVGIVDPNGITMIGSKYYRYMGSLTTPPCTQGVLWTVNKEVASVSFEQVAVLRAAVHDGFHNNARPLQPLNGRKVNLYEQRVLNGIPFITSSAQPL